MRARITTLEQQLANLQKDYALLLSVCQTSAGPPQDTAAAERQRAADAARTAQIEADNRRAQLRQDQDLENALWFVKSVNFGVTEANDVFVRFGWNVTVKNGISRPQMFDLVVQFLNPQGLVVDTAREYRQTIQAFEERTIYGTTLVRMPGALTVRSVHATATRRKQ